MQHTHLLISVENAITTTRDLISQKLFCQRHRAQQRDFTRNRQLPFMKTMVLLLQKTTRSIQAHLHSFFEALGQCREVVTPSAWSQARLKLRHTAFIELNEEAVLKVIYPSSPPKPVASTLKESEEAVLQGVEPQPGSFSVHRWRGLRVLAIDSSLVRLPNEERIGQEFGWVECSNENGVYGRYPQARLSVLTDVLNRIALQTFFVPWAQGERELAIQHIQCLQPEDLSLLDRGFGGYEVFAHFVKAKRWFVCRCPKSSFAAVNQVFKENREGQSAQVTLRPDRHHLAQIREAGLPEEITIRLVTVRLSTGELEVLATNLLSEELYPTACFAQLYGHRWGIETYYGLVKGRLDLENFSGLSPEALRQDVYSTIFLSNLESILTRPANEQLQEQSRDLKNRQQVNHAVCFHSIKSHMIALLLSQEPVSQVVEKLQQLFLDNPTAVRPERKTPRRKHSDCRSYQYQRNIRKSVF